MDESKDRDFDCLCDAVFTTPAELTAHLMRDHPGFIEESPAAGCANGADGHYRCWCGLTYCGKARLGLHVTDQGRQSLKKHFFEHHLGIVTEA
jgi:hypothetical protein